MAARPPGVMFVAACLAALLLRLLVPAGWMPVAGNPALLSLCSTAAAGPAADLPGDADAGPCGFALALGPALLAPPPLLLPALLLAGLLLLAGPLPIVPRRARLRLRPPGQGPPLC